MNIGFIGAGAMGGAIAGAICKKINESLPKKESDLDEAGKDSLTEDFWKELKVNISTKDPSHAEQFAKKYDCGFSKDNKTIAQWADYLFLAVKPKDIESVLKEIKFTLLEKNTETTIITMAAGVTIKKIEDIICLGSGRLSYKVIRIMPNIAGSVGAGLTALTLGNNLDSKDILVVKKLLEVTGEVAEITEDKINALTCVSGSAIAFFFIAAEALTDASVKLGISRSDASKYAAQTIAGAAALLKNGQHPAKLKDAVTSPAGTTIEGVAFLERAGFRSAIIDAVSAMDKKCSSMQK